MTDLLRDSTLGQAINALSGGRLLSYADQRPSYQIPSRYLLSPPLSQVSTIVNGEEKAQKPTYSTPSPSPAPSTRKPDSGNDVETLKDVVIDQAEKAGDEYLVDWDGPDDQDNPRNWSKAKKGFVAFCISLLTFSVYIGSAIYTSSFPGVMSTFGVSQTEATLGLMLYVLAYGIGPMFLTPLQELPSLGRNPVYIVGLALFVLFNVPIVKAQNLGIVLAFRFLTGFVGSPALATGGASMADLFDGPTLPYVIGIWCLGAVGGPVLGPVIGGFAAQAKDWRWPIYELMWISGFALAFLFVFLPETFEANILLKRARRLRKLTGNPHLRSRSEIEQAAMSKREIAFESLVRPFLLAAEPAVFFLNVYIGLVYSVFYLWFEAFPLVFNEIYHMNLGVGSLPFVAFIVSGAFAYTGYCLYLRYHFQPRLDKNPDLAVEARLEFGLMASIFIPISLFMFGWTSRESVHWIAPVIAAALYLPGIFLTFQSVLVYLSVTYSKYTGSILASNDLFRSTMASVFPLFGSVFFRNLGLGPGCSLLAGISILLMVIYYTLIRYGHILRSRSRYANSN
ncbi:MFS general substrate transporter [Marasmius fiardii PR-910]|nr:MFS general substrate transporter [Marasmius fiardii PR-910]